MVARAERIWAGVVAACCLAALCVAASLTPDSSGHGTHTQLGLHGCGWLLKTGFPCATCGMTTAVSAAANGEWLFSLRSQPFGTVLAVGTAAAFWGSLHVAVFGSRVGRVCGRLLQGAYLWLVAGAWGLSWAYTVMTWK